MALGPRLELRQTQSLVMTPQLRQAIKLLQFTNLEVAAFIEEELERNPLLERDESPEFAAEQPALDQRAAPEPSGEPLGTDILVGSPTLPDGEAAPLDTDYAEQFDGSGIDGPGDRPAHETSCEYGGLASRGFDDGSGPTPRQVADCARQALENVMRLGGAKPGDKTLVDAFAPFAERLHTEIAGGVPLAEAWRRATEAAHAAAEATASLLPRLGRARPHAERSRGHRDAGAVSFVLAAQAVMDIEEFRP